MHTRFPRRAYVDLFSGPGRCVCDDGSGELDGTPLIALGIPHPFTDYHFVEADPAATAALRTRVQSGGTSARVAYHDMDANAAVDAIAGQLPTDALSVTVIDPTGLHLGYENLRKLTNGRRMDLIYIFPEGMAAKRNVDKFLPQSNSRLDEALGTRAWRDRVAAGMSVAGLADPQAQWENLGRPIVEVLREQLAVIGYADVKLGSEVLIRNTKHVPLYYIVFASKHTLGTKFWNAIRRFDPVGQMTLL
jgi:three-Cys-motif partner protein